MAQADQPLAELARHAAGLQFATLPDTTVERAKTFIVDTLACGLAGSAGPFAQDALVAAANWGKGADANVWGKSDRLPCVSAAFVNAYQIHCLEFDCVHEPSVLHPMSSLLAALVADAQAHRLEDGSEFIAAVAAGIDVTCTIGAATSEPMKFFRPSLLGAFGATAAVARARRFSEQQTANAMGMVYGLISGTLQAHVEGSPLLGLQVGFAARSAVMACDLSENEIPAPGKIFTGRYGLFALYEPSRDWHGEWSALSPGGRLLELSHKPFPSGRLTHYAVDAVQQLLADPGLNPDHIESVLVRVPPLVERLVGRPDDPNADANYLKLSVPYVVAVALRRGTVENEDFRNPGMRDEAVHKLAARVSVESFDAPPNAFGPVHVEVVSSDGVRLAKSVEYGIGHPRNPLDRTAQEQKFWRCWDEVNPPLLHDQGNIMLQRLWALENERKLHDLFDHLMPSRGLRDE